MGKFERSEKVGLREIGTKKLIAVYPHKPEGGNDDKIERDVKFWYYQQGCEAEEMLHNLYVDGLTEHELKSTRS